MAHQEATLATGHPLLGNAGGIVTIAKVEASFANSQSANNGIKYRCAGCNVLVSAVITASNKPGRKTSPASHFRASTVPHRKGCKKGVRTPGTPSAPLGGTRPANPTKAPYPTKWVSAPATAAQPPGGSGTGGALNPKPGAGTRGGFSTSGSGTSVSTSKLVEIFARAWLQMTTPKRQSAGLSAPWNPGGTYESAFFDLHQHTLSAVPLSPEHIFYGEVVKVHKGTSGYTLTLAQRHANGEELLIWVQNPTAHSGASGASLWSQLVAGGVVGRKIFAKGTFLLEQRPTVTWYSLPVITGEDVWLV
jgi:hypothetical protein